MSPKPATAAQRYRTRHIVKDGFTSFPTDNLLWREHKVPLRREDATVQLDLLAPEERPALPGSPPDRERLMLERVERTLRDTLETLRPQFNRAIREVEMHLEACNIRYPEHQVVDELLAVLDKHLRRFVKDAVAFKTWSNLSDRD